MITPSKRKAVNDAPVPEWIEAGDEDYDPSESEDEGGDDEGDDDESEGGEEGGEVEGVDEDVGEDEGGEEVEDKAFELDKKMYQPLLAQGRRSPGRASGRCVPESTTHYKALGGSHTCTFHPRRHPCLPSPSEGRWQLRARCYGAL